MKAEYIAVRSALFGFNFLICLVLLILGVIPGVIYILYKVTSAKHSVVEFYEGKYIIKSGIINTREQEVVFKGVLSVVCSQDILGKMFGYGTIRADITGKEKLNLEGVKDPDGLKAFLLTKKIDASEASHIITN